MFRNLNIILLVFCTLVVLLISLFWYFQHNQLKEIKQEFREKSEELASPKWPNPFDINFRNLNDSILLISYLDVERVNRHIDGLRSEVRNESNRAESIIDKDIDRLNLYMAVGIGFMTLLGVFVPVLVNITSTQNLNNEVNSLRNQFSEFNNDREDLSKGINKIEEYLKIQKKGSINEANNKLQASIGRFYNMWPLYFNKINREDINANVVNLIEDVIEALKLCESLDDHLINKNRFFINNVNDFIQLLDTEKTKLNMVFSQRKDIEVIDHLIESLKELLKSTPENESKKYADVFKNLNRFRSLISERVVDFKSN
ncbi:hypothetical protein QYS48_00240 [Marivirga arenosa]|uniref:Uncharacterized protein n=1 Tax=Marivirga arenosa TaxID=3059076 RepID=A0AA49GI31_9BACT|nr:hypothetical protein [Marivirga sp. ABR2-2]WKK85587.1 hypothetical protein QYS48_00240 [Marivirga sp. ABR2-2]